MTKGDRISDKGPDVVEHIPDIATPSTKGVDVRQTYYPDKPSPGRPVPDQPGPPSPPPTPPETSRNDD